MSLCKCVSTWPIAGINMHWQYADMAISRILARELHGIGRSVQGHSFCPFVQDTQVVQMQWENPCDIQPDIIVAADVLYDPGKVLFTSHAFVHNLCMLPHSGLVVADYITPP